MSRLLMTATLLWDLLFKMTSNRDTDRPGHKGLSYSSTTKHLYKLKTCIKYDAKQEKWWQKMWLIKTLYYWNFTVDIETAMEPRVSHGAASTCFVNQNNLWTWHLTSNGFLYSSPLATLGLGLPVTIKDPTIGGWPLYLLTHSLPF